MKYRIKIEQPKNSGNFIWWSLPGTKKSKMDELKWAKSEYPDQVFKLVQWTKNN